MITLKKLTLIFLLFITSLSAQALEVIRVNIEQNSTNQSVDIELFDNIALNTVNNFLSYLDDGSYENIFINRSVTNFVIQTGGYTYDESLGGFSISDTDQFNAGLQPVLEKADIDNEFSLSNLRGTLAMAKMGGFPDSANKQWFVNLLDNTFLDDANGGFTVFGKILGNGMTIIDSISTIPVYDLTSQLNNNDAFQHTPLTNFNDSLTVQDISNSNLVFLNTFKHLLNITDTIDFGDAIAGTSIQRDVVITNTGDEPLTTGAIDSSMIIVPFSIITNNCENVTLTAGTNCTITVEFAPTSNDYFTSSLNVEISTYGYTFPITLTTPTAKIVPSLDSINFGAQPVFDENSGMRPKQQSVYIYNYGNRDLHLTSIVFSGINSNEFEFIDNCTTSNNDNVPGEVLPRGFCILVVNFKPTDLNVKQASIEIISDDPVNSLIIIDITGGTTDDSDGVARSIEDAGPNNGDGDNDELSDGLQDHVTSFPSANNVYTTLITDDSMSFSEVKAVQLSSLPPLPTNIKLDNEAFSFELSGFIPGSIVEFGIILPARNSPDNIYAFGPTADNNLPHWYLLEKNAIPGVLILGDASLGDKAIKRNVTKVSILDGGAGDSDLQANGVISFVGGPEVSNSSSSGSGSILWLLILLSFSTLIYRK